MSIITRAKARELGLKRFFTGQPCRNGHKSERYTAGGGCCECHAERSKQYDAKNRATRLEYMRHWRSVRNDHIREYDRSRRHDHGVTLARRAYGLLHNCLAAKGVSPTYKASKELGYSPAQLRAHIEAQFSSGMCWDNYGEWHIDHIVPVADHISRGEADPAVINCLTNLRPIWAEENIRKGNARTHLL